MNRRRSGCRDRATSGEAAGGYSFDRAFGRNADVLSSFVLSSMSGQERVVVDLNEVTLAEAAALRALLICEAHATRAGAASAVRHVHGEVARLLEITDTAHLISDR